MVSLNTTELCYHKDNLKTIHKEMTMRPITQSKEYIEFLNKELGESMERRVEKIASKIVYAWKNDKRVFVCGNGGAAAIASHFTNDLLKFIPGGIDATCLTDNIPFITAVANDLSYEMIFSEQLVVSANPGDLLVAISTSGKSKNVIQAVKSAGVIGMEVLALTAASVSPLVTEILHSKGSVMMFYHPDIRGQEDLISIALHIAVGEVSTIMMSSDDSEEVKGR